MCQKECKDDCACDDPMTATEVSGFITCACDTSKNFVQAQAGCVCMSGRYQLIKNGVYSCVDATECNSDENLVDERTQRCVTQEECKNSNKLVSLDKKSCKVVGDQDCEKRFGNQCGCSGFVAPDGKSCARECDYFEPRYAKTVEIDGKTVEQQFCGYLKDNSECVNGLVLDNTQQTCRCDAN